MPTADELVAEHFKIKDWVEGESKRFEEHIKPQKQRLAEINDLLLAELIKQGCNNFKTEHGTASKSTIVTPKVDNREAFLDWVNDNWDAGGNEMLQLSAPQKDALENYKQEHSGQLPPGVTTSSFIRVNIRRS